MAGPNQTPGPTAIRAPTPDLSNHQTVLTQLKETTETAQRLRGNPLQSYVTLGELISAGIIKFLGGVVSPGDKIAKGGSGTVHVLDSITGDGSTGTPLQLSGDSASPGNTMLYGTNGSGTRGWYAQPGGSLTVTDGTNSVTGTTNLQFSGATVSGTTPSAVVTINSSVALPGTLANLIYWFKSDPIVSSFLPVLNNFAPGLVTYSPTASTSASGATGAASTLNSLNVVQFPGTAAGVYTFPSAGGTGFLLKNSTTFMVFKPTIVAGVGQNFHTGPSGSLEVDINTTGHLEIVKSLIAIIGGSTSTLTSGVWFQGNVTYADSTGAWAFRIARTASGSGTNVQTITGNNNTIASVPGFSFFLNGLLAEMIIYNRVLTPTEVTNVENYLFAKWGV